MQQTPASASPTPCHIAVDRSGRVAVAANYHLGLAARLPLGGDGSLGTPRVVAHTRPGSPPHPPGRAHVHSANFSPDGRFAIVCDLGLDRIYSYRIDRDAVALVTGRRPTSPQPRGSGPGTSRSAGVGRHAYVINELDNTIVAYAYDAGQRTLVAPASRVRCSPWVTAARPPRPRCGSTRPGASSTAPAAGPDYDRRLCGGPRHGSPSRPIETVPCGGKGPRNFSLTPDGAWLVCAHQDSDTPARFAVDRGSGRLRRVPGADRGPHARLRPLPR